MRHYDLAIAYRCFPGFSGGYHLFNGNKKLMVDVCVRSLKNSLGNLKTRIYVILDNCPEYETLFTPYWDSQDLSFHIPEHDGRNKNIFTYKVQCDLLLDDPAPYLLWCEDDYYFFSDKLEGQVAMMQSHPEVDFSTPYNHPDYFEHHYHQVPHIYSNSFKYDDMNWYTCASTCCTFMGRRDICKEAECYLRLYEHNHGDWGQWITTTWLPNESVQHMAMPGCPNKGHGWRPSDNIYTLYRPEKSIGSHLGYGTQDRNYDWDNILSTAISEVNS